MAILQGARITGSIIATSFIKASGFSGSLTASNLYVLGKAGIGTTSPGAKLDIRQTSAATGLKVFTNDTSTAYIAQFIGYDNSLGDITRMVVQAGGSVGIGTTSPTRKLHIDGGSTTTVGIYLDATGISGTDLEQSSDAFRFQIRDNVPALFYTNNTERMRITSGGNVGIGTTSINAKLDILQSSTSNNQIKIYSDDGTAQLRTYSTSDGYGLIINQYYAVAGSPYLRSADFVASTGDVSSTMMRFFTKDYSSNPAERMRIDSSGNVGIGTTSAAYTLQVGTGANSATARAAFLGGYTVFENSAGTGNPSITFNNDTDTGILNPAANTIVFTTNGSEKVRIDSTGKVGIGTSSPNNRLDVVGATGTTINMSNSDDGNRGGKLTFISSSATGRQFYVGTNSSIYNLVFGIDSVEKARIDLNGNLLVGTTTSPSNTGMSLGATGTVRQLLGGMENTSWRIRERDQIDALAITTNINDAGTQDSSTRSSWKLRMGWGNGQDNFVIARSPVASNSFSDLFYIKSDGNVGIGTTAPVSKLHIVDTEATITLQGNQLSGTRYNRLRFANQPGTIQQEIFGGYYGIGGLSIADYGNSGIYFGVSNTPGTFTERVRIANDGNVGIGTTNPASKLYVVSSGSPIARFDGSSVAASSATEIDILGPQSNGDLNLGIGGSTFTDVTNNIQNKAFITAGTGLSGLNLRSDSGYVQITAGGVASSNEVARFTSSGNVGIGTSSPANKFHVIVAGGLYNASITNQSRLTGSVIIQADNSGANSRASLIMRGADTIGGAISVAREDTSVTWKTYMAFYTNNVTGVNVTDIQEKMRLNADGNLGIGTSSPAYKLDVNGLASSNNGFLSKGAFSGMSGVSGALIDYDSGNTRIISNTAAGNSTISFLIGNSSAFSNAMVINSSGNVGIGTSSPTSKLDIRPTTDGDAGISIGTGGTVSGTISSPANLFINANTGNAQSGDGRIGFGFQRTGFTGGSEVMRIIENGGKVGIGTTSPANKLHISGSSTNLPLKLEGLTSNATGYFLTVDNTTGVVHKSTSGASGTSGTSGANGSPGTSGTSGANGSPGTSGSNGANGSPGTSGTSGANGSPGTSGSSGISSIKAWVHFNGGGTSGTSGISPNASNNVSSITDNGTGDYTINFTTAFANANYVVAGTATYEYENPGQSINNMFIAVPRRPNAQLAGSCRISTPGSDNVLYDCQYVRVLFSN